MQPKTIGKRSVDLAMTLLLLLLMARQITGETAHEWLGAGMFALWVAHHALNASWHRRLFRGRYTPFRVCQLVVNLLLLLAMVGTMVSGVVLSQTVFAFLPISGGRSWAQPLHILASFWGLVLMALHLGLHWGAILGQVRRQSELPARPAARWVWRLLGLAVAGYGGYAFWYHQLPLYLSAQAHFVFFDAAQPAVGFFLDYLAILGLFVWLAHYGGKGLQALARRKRPPEPAPW